MTNKTIQTSADVASFIGGIDDDQKRSDSEVLVTLMQDITGEKPAMWGPSIVGFGTYHYRSAAGREGDWFILGFSPRKQALTLYLPGYVEQHQALLDQIGKHSTGKGCVYIKRLSDTDPIALRKLLETAVATRPT